MKHVILKEKPSLQGYNSNFAIIICNLPDNPVTPFATWLLNKNSNERMHGDYCYNYDDAERSFLDRK